MTQAPRYKSSLAPLLSLSERRLAEHDADVLDGVVRVDVQVALGLDHEVDHPVPCDLVEHVVEERHAGGEIGAARPVEVEVDLDLRFRRVALDGSAAGDEFGGCVHA